MNKIEDKIGDNYFMGNAFVWWQGVVEDVDDPLKLGRCRVRVAGYHNPSTQLLPTQDLPWAVSVQPITSASISEVGTSPTGLLPGSWVLGFFRDPGFFQQPVILGSIPGIPTKKGVDIGDGFKDPSKTYPLDTHLFESDLSRLARNENIDKTIVETKKNDRTKDITVALKREKWNQPEVPYAAEYPKNHVMQTQSGHVQEFDDTPKHDRIQVYHKTGTFQEIHPDGTTVNKIVSEKYEIVYDDSRILIKGLKSENVEGNSNLKVGKDFNVEVNGNAFVLIKGDCIMETKGDYFHKIGGTCNIISNGTMTLIGSSIHLNPGTAAGDVGGLE